MKYGIMGAIPEEISGLVEAMAPSRRKVERGRREYHEGQLFGREVVCVFSRIGKVAAATTATELLNYFGVDAIVFTGVAGAVDPGLRVGDIIVGSSFYQHDMDASPLFPRHEIPLLGLSALPADRAASERAKDAAQRFVAKRAAWVPDGVATEFGIGEPKVVEAQIASGDKFFASSEALEELRLRLPEVACVEMEGAAVAQVCHEYEVPLTVLRTISDAADEDAAVDFARFIRLVASRYSLGILSEFLSA